MASVNTTTCDYELANHLGWANMTWRNGTVYRVEVSDRHHPSCAPYAHLSPPSTLVNLPEPEPEPQPKPPPAPRPAPLPSPDSDLTLLAHLSPPPTLVNLPGVNPNPGPPAPEPTRPTTPKTQTD